MSAVRPTLEPTRQMGSYVDPAGTVYELDGRILRGIRPEFAQHFSDLLSNPTIQKMLGQELIETTTGLDELEGYPLVLEHRRISPLSFCYEWPAWMLQDAALLTLDICIKLNEQGLVLQDASPWNVVFEGSRPVFVDFTSIVAQDPHLLWVAYDQFCRLFLYPLMLSSYLPGKAVRAFLQDSINGVSADDLVHLLPGHAVLRAPWLLGRVHLPRLLLTLVRRLDSDKALTRMSARLAPGLEARRSFFVSLRNDVKSVSLRTDKSRWVRYYTDMETFLHPAEFNTKQATVARLLSEVRPKTVTDIGCNRGGYSILAAQAGAQVTAFDTDEDSVTALYQLVHEKKLDILPLVIDVLNPSPACGWRAMQFPSAPQRFRSEMALALALVHHLAITQRQTFERIVPALADYADKWLLTEFVPLSDPRSQELLATHRRDMSWFTLEGFLEALGRFFTRTETFPLHPTERTLILCAK